jgi:hypothetical protein
VFEGLGVLCSNCGTRAIYFSNFVRYRFISDHSSLEMRLCWGAKTRAARAVPSPT